MRNSYSPHTSESNFVDHEGFEQQEGFTETITKLKRKRKTPICQLSLLPNATENFSTKNKLGEGGFGPVYKLLIASQSRARGSETKENTITKQRNPRFKEFCSTLLFFERVTLLREKKETRIGEGSELRSVPGLRFGENDDHTLKGVVEERVVVA
ncbi:hypothetical protein Fmac_009013 [Flemingia macrophylla]|uniref:Protein kinase n=1 Tax=Flemingia macrophylla TaxID=520843 RepID=A0ABD1N078_9FABA